MRSHRPVYETREDLAAEEEAAKTIGETLQRQDPSLYMIKTSALYPYDYLMMKKQPDDKNGSWVLSTVEGLIEIKVRTNVFKKYSTYMISLQKVVNCVSHADIIGCDFFLYVQWTNGIGWWKFDRNQYTVNFGGRTDRGDSADVEPMLYIPIEHFNWSRNPLLDQDNEGPS